MLSCENIKDCEKSLIQILNINLDMLDEIKNEIRYYQQDSNAWNLDVILSKYNIVIKENISVCFFHFTKSMNPDLFNNGLKTLPYVLNSIVEEISTLYGLHSKSEIMKIIDDKLLLASRIRLHNFDVGPYGFFIKQHGFLDNSDSFQYLNGSEFVTDLLVALGYDESIYHSVSKSIIIKFKVDNLTTEKQMYYIKEALIYMTFGADIEKLKSMSSSHDNFGVQVNPCDILNIEFL